MGNDHPEIKYDIVLLPDEDLCQRAVDASEQLRGSDTWFTLSECGPFPHVSLYMVRLRMGDLPKVTEKLAAIAQGASMQNLAVASYTQEGRYICAHYGRTRGLDQIQADVVDAINPIRNGLSLDDQTAQHDDVATGLACTNMEVYGYQPVGELFRPHLTLTRLKSNNPVETLPLPVLLNLGGTYIKLGIFEMGDHSTCARKIADFELGKL